MSSPSGQSLLVDGGNPKKTGENGRAVVLIEDVYPHAFWLEKYNRLSRPTDTVFDHFNVHSIARTPPTLKLSSRADNQLLQSPKYVHDDDRIRYFIHLADQKNQLTRAKDRTHQIRVTSHIYGSHPTFERFDDRGQPIRECFWPKRHAMLSDFSEQLVRYRITERPKFIGKVPFNL